MLLIQLMFLSITDIIPASYLSSCLPISQIAYLIVGWAIMTVSQCAFFLLVTFTTILPILKIYPDWFWGPWLFRAVVPLFISLGFYYLQVMLVKFFFTVSW